MRNAVPKCYSNQLLYCILYSNQEYIAIQLVEKLKQLVCLGKLSRHLWLLWVKSSSLTNLSFHSLSIYILPPLVFSVFTSCIMANEKTYIQFPLPVQSAQAVFSSLKNFRFYTRKLGLYWWEAICHLWKKDVNIFHVHQRGNRLKTNWERVLSTLNIYLSILTDLAIAILLLVISFSDFSWSMSIHPLKSSLGSISSESLPMNIRLDVCSCLPPRF